MEQDFFKKVDVISFDYLSDLSFKPSSCLRMNQALGEAYGMLSGSSVQALAPQGFFLMLANIVCEFGEKKPMESEIDGSMWINHAQGRLITNSMKFTNSTNDYLFGFTNYYLVVDAKERKALWPKDLPTDIPQGRDEYSVKNPEFNFNIDVELKQVDKRVIRRSEIDILGHVNNTFYPVFALDTFTKEDFKRGISRMVLRFFSELRRGDEITILRGQDQNNLYFVGENKEGKHSFEILFEMKQPLSAS